MKGVDLDFYMGIEYDDSGQYDGPRNRFVFYTDNSLWRHLMLKKDLQPENLRWYL